MHLDELPERSQDYLKHIYDLEEWAGTRGVGLSALAEAMGQRRSTTSEAVKRLAGDGLVEHAPYADVKLTEQGRGFAIQLVRRHRLIETFLVRELGYGVEEVHDEAEVLEHAVSDLFIERVDERLGRPDRDPHGDPIPDASGRLAPVDDVVLSEAAPGQRVRVSRLRDRDEEFLRHMTAQGVVPGAELRVEERPYPQLARFSVLSAPEGHEPPGGPVDIPAGALGEIQVELLS